MKNQNEIVNELLRSANENGLLPTLDGVFGKEINVSIAFSQRACDTSIDELDFSVRASNALKRASVFTIGEIIDLIANEDLTRIRNLGRKTVNEIKTRILMYGYDQLTTPEKMQFFYDITQKNIKM
jgi:DNA-directed RNA polymerase alpha subunit